MPCAQVYWEYAIEPLTREGTVSQPALHWKMEEIGKSRDANFKLERNELRDFLISERDLTHG
jgi:hypothetical protein